MSGVSLFGKSNNISIMDLQALKVDLKNLKKDGAAFAGLEMAQIALPSRYEKEPPPGLIADNHPSQIYAHVKVGGKIVATVYNSGAIGTDGNFSARLQASFAEDMNVGPKLALERAERVAEAMGGKVEMADTALNQQQWQSWKANRDAGLAAYYNNSATHIAAQEATTTANAESEGEHAGSSGKSSAVDDFRDFLKKSPIERLIDQILASMGLTKEELEALPPEQQKAVMKEVAERVKEILSGQVAKDGTDPAASV